MQQSVWDKRAMQHESFFITQKGNKDIFEGLEDCLFE